ncbi:MAG: zinc ribbon domain-containing protein [Planctomycetota bacterium]
MTTTDIREALQTLVQLQTLDHRITDLTRQRDALPAALRSVMREIDVANKALQAERDTAKKLQAAIDERELAIKANEARIADLKRKQGGVKTNKEYQALTLDIENVQLDTGNQEEAELEAMSALEQAKERVAEAERVVRKHEADRDRQQGVLDGKVAGFDKQINALAAERKGVAEALDEELREQYEDLRAYRDGEAVAPVTSEGICQGCMTRITPENMQHVVSGSKLVVCPSCHRILYPKDAPPAS